MQSVRLIQYTDMHLFGDAAGRLRGVATLPALQAAIADGQRRCSRPDGILLTGDLVQDDPDGYRWISTSSVHRRCRCCACPAITTCPTTCAPRSAARRSKCPVIGSSAAGWS